MHTRPEVHGLQINLYNAARVAYCRADKKTHTTRSIPGDVGSRGLCRHDAHGLVLARDLVGRVSKGRHVGYQGGALDVRANEG